MQIRYHDQRMRHYNRRRPPVRDTLGLRLGVSLLLTALALAVRHWDPALLEPVRTQLLADSGEVAEAFSRFTGALSGGAPAVEAWSALRSDLAAEWGAK